MKKILMILAIGAIFALSACRFGGSSTNKTTEPEKDSTELIVPPTASDTTVIETVQDSTEIL